MNDEKKSDWQRWVEVFAVRVPAKDIRPTIWGLPYVTAEGKFIVGKIVSRHWDEEGKRIWFGLDSHNTFRGAESDELVSVVALMTIHAGIGDAGRAQIIQDAAKDQERLDEQHKSIVSKARRVLDVSPSSKAWVNWDEEELKKELEPWPDERKKEE